MLATTWVQIIKAVQLLSGALHGDHGAKHVNFDVSTLFSEAIKVHPKGEAIMSPGGLVKGSDLGILLGFCADVRHRRAAAHPDALLHRQQTPRGSAQERAFYATGFIGYFCILTFIIGFWRDPAGQHQPGTSRTPPAPWIGGQQHGGGALG